MCNNYDVVGCYLLDLPYGSNISPLVFSLIQETDDRVHVKIYDPKVQRWEVPAR